jgi:tRNA G26 N,N-dimethylase Trm1
MTLTAKLLICPIWQKAYIVKLKAIGKKETRQRAVLGSTIAFPQEYVLMEHSKLPRTLSELSRSLSVIFVGSTPPSHAKLARVFRVDSKDLRTVLNGFRSNGYDGSQSDTFNMEAIETFEIAPSKGIQELLKDCIHSVDA